MSKVDLKPHFMTLSGQQYLKVSGRVLMFREQCPGGSIHTEMLKLDLDKGFALFSATILDGDGKMLAMAHGSETLKGFPAGWIEKAETVAVGRALAMAGFGTSFALADFYEQDGSKLADAPVPAPDPSAASKKAPAAALLGSSIVTKDDLDRLWTRCKTRKLDGAWLKETMAKHGMPDRTSELTVDQLTELDIIIGKIDIPEVVSGAVYSKRKDV